MQPSELKTTRRSFRRWRRREFGPREGKIRLIGKIVRGFDDDCAKIASGPMISDLDLHGPRTGPPDSRSGIVSKGVYDWLSHSFGKSTAGNLHMIMRHMPEPVNPAKAKPESDPKGILKPGILIDPDKRKVDRRGSLTT